MKNSKNLGAEKLLKIMEEYFHAAGAYGVIAGQVVDIESEHSTPENPQKTLDYIHTHKTADLFKLALRTGAIIAEATDEQLKEITEFGQCLGVAFQVSDDILDEISTFEEMGKTLGKDNCLALSVHTPYMRGSESAAAKGLCSNLGVKLEIENMQIPDEILSNPPDRCYICKSKIF